MENGKSLCIVSLLCFFLLLLGASVLENSNAFSDSYDYNFHVVLFQDGQQIKKFNCWRYEQNGDRVTVIDAKGNRRELKDSFSIWQRGTK